MATWYRECSCRGDRLLSNEHLAITKATWLPNARMLLRYALVGLSPVRLQERMLALASYPQQGSMFSHRR
ncbi:hypothetical protein V2G26_005755 [Clonostachys chloroleuca]